jgi:multisubunit Na+/H+ antiporter MnhE subunit
LSIHSFLFLHSSFFIYWTGLTHFIHFFLFFIFSSILHITFRRLFPSTP